jgi:hypothetical protein
MRGAATHADARNPSPQTMNQKFWQENCLSLGIFLPIIFLPNLCG